MISIFHSQELSKPPGQILTWCVYSYQNFIWFTVLLLSHVEKDVKLSPQLFLKATSIGLNPGANSEILSRACIMWSPSYYQFQALHLGLWSMLSYCLLQVIEIDPYYSSTWSSSPSTICWRDLLFSGICVWHLLSNIK